MFDSLASINTSKSEWRIKVRVTRIWNHNVDHVLQGINLVLLDNAVTNMNHPTVFYLFFETYNRYKYLYLSCSNLSFFSRISMSMHLLDHKYGICLVEI